MAINIRPATMSDVPALQSLIEQSVRKLSQGFYDDEQIDSALKFIFGVDSQLIEDGTYFVAETEGLIVGAGGWSKRSTLYGGDQRKDEIDSLLDPEREPARVRAFYVHPDWSRRGISRQILAACEAAAAAAGFKRAELVATLPGEPLYAALGYSKFEPVEMNMPDGRSIGGFRMGKELKDK